MCKINELKVQEKVGTICNNPNSFMYALNKNLGRKDGKSIKCPYEKGDNDLYWLNCKDLQKFYLIPESVLIENGFVGKDCNKLKLFVSPINKNTSFTQEYLFDYTALDKEKFMKLITPA